MNVLFAKGTFLSRKEDFIYKRKVLFQIVGPSGCNRTLKQFDLNIDKCKKLKIKAVYLSICSSMI